MDRNILLIAEDQTIIQTLESLLEQHKEGFTLLTEKESVRAHQLLADHFISLVVLEATASEKDDIELLTLARNLFPGTPVVIITEDSTTTQLSNYAGKEKDITALSKPLQPDNLANIVLGILEKESAGGIMRHISPAVFLQFMDIESQSCTIRILDSASNTGGALYFDKGDLIDARVNKVEGIDAAYIIFSWEDDVTIFIQNDCPLTENKINSELQPIILKAASMKSGATDAKNSTPGLNKETTPPRKATPGKKAAPKTDMSFTQKLEFLLQKTVGARCSVEDIYQDPSSKHKIYTLSQLEGFFRFGKLKLAYIQEEAKADRILIPKNTKTVVVDIASNGLHETIIRVLQDRL